MLKYIFILILVFLPIFANNREQCHVMTPPLAPLGAKEQAPDPLSRSVVLSALNSVLSENMSIDPRQIVWMRSQWKRFRLILCICTGIAWLVCCAGIILLGREDLPILLSMIFMLLVVTGLFIYLLWMTRRELKSLDRQAIELRAQALRAEGAKTG